jgi:hypothetical protein
VFIFKNDGIDWLAEGGKPAAAAAGGQVSEPCRP